MTTHAGLPALPWGGPDWAAPQAAERLMSQPVPRGPSPDPVWRITVDMLGKGKINPYQFQTAMRITHASRRQEQEQA